MKFSEIVASVRKNGVRKTWGEVRDPGLSPGPWIAIFLGIVVLFIIIASLWTVFSDAVTDLGNVSDNPFGASFGTIIFLLVFVALLLMVVGVLLGKTKLKGA